MKVKNLENLRADLYYNLGVLYFSNCSTYPVKLAYFNGCDTNKNKITKLNDSFIIQKYHYYRFNKINDIELLVEVNQEYVALFKADCENKYYEPLSNVWYCDVPSKKLLFMEVVKMIMNGIYEVCDNE